MFISTIPKFCMCLQSLGSFHCTQSKSTRGSTRLPCKSWDEQGTGKTKKKKKKRKTAKMTRLREGE